MSGGADRYRIERRLARGGMAEILEATAVGAAGFERAVAIKRLLPEHGADPSFERMFIDEARIASRLHHPNIVSVLDFGVAGGAPFQVLELVEGLDAGRLRMRGDELGAPLDLDSALHIAAETARGLHHAHTASGRDGRPLGIVHRDVSPQNVLVSWTGEVKLSDLVPERSYTLSSRARAGVSASAVRWPILRPGRASRLP